MSENEEFERPKIDLQQFSLPRFSKSYILKLVIYVVVLVVIVYFLSLKLARIAERSIPVNEIKHISIDTTNSTKN
jgi:uncharacterized membrane protein (Fun14 family)